MAKRTGDRGEKIMIEPGDNPWKIAVVCVGDGRRWPELVDANPSKARSDATGNFVSLMPGEVLRLPGSWLEKMGGVPVVHPIVAPGGEIGSLHDAGRSSPPEAAGVSSLPYGWSDSDLDIVVGMARGWKMQPEDLMAIWFSESGAQPRCRSVGLGCIPSGQPMPEGKIGYYGLIMGADKFVSPTLGWPSGTWERIVTKESVAVQLQAIAQFWDKQQKAYLGGESAVDRGERIGVSTAAVIYALNFVPAIAGHANGPNFVLVRPGSLIINGRDAYKDNAGLDVDGDGAITMKDMEARVINRRNALAAGGPGRQLYLAVRDAAGGAVPSLATLWAPITSTWQDLTGKNPVTTVGWRSGNDGPMGPGERGAGLVETIAILAAAAAAIHYGWPYVSKLLKKGG